MYLDPRTLLLAYTAVSALFGFGFDLGAPGVWAGFGVGLALAAGALGWRFFRLSRAKAPPATVDAAD